MAAAWQPVSRWAQLDYAFTAPESWAENCLGGAEAAAGLLDWDEAGARRPEVVQWPTYESYVCRWEEEFDPPLVDEELEIEIRVSDSRAFEPPSIDWLTLDDWLLDKASLTGWEHGYCRAQSDASGRSTYQCAGMTANLKVIVTCRSSTSYRNAITFGPGTGFVENIAVDLSGTVRETFTD